MSPSDTPISRVRFVHRLLRARDWQDRPEFGQLCDWWRDGGRGVCALVGIGGAGKTAIAERFFRVLPGVLHESAGVSQDDSLSAPPRSFVFSFYAEHNADAFLAQVAAWLRGEVYDQSAQQPSYYETLTLLAGAGDCLLLLDGLEKLQERGTCAGPFGRITDNRLRDLVCRVADGCLPAVRIVITTRFPLIDTPAAGSLLYRKVPVERLSAEAAIALLRRRGVKGGTDGQLDDVARDQGFHALSVDLIGGYIARFCRGDPTRMPPAPKDRPASQGDAPLDPQLAAIREHESKFVRLIERYHEALSRSDPAGLALLQRVCLFRLGIDAVTLASIFLRRKRLDRSKNRISGKHLARLNQRQLEAKLKVLEEMGLVGASDFSSPSTLYTLHPAVRDGFLGGLDAETSRLSHEAAREALEASLDGLPKTGSKPSDNATLDLLEEIVFHTLKAGRAREALDVYFERIGGYNNLGWRLGAYERGDRICGEIVRQFELGDTKTEDPRLSGLLAEWGTYLGFLVKIDAAVEQLRRCIHIEVAHENWENAAIASSNMCAFLLDAGNLREARLSLRDAAHFARGATWACEGIVHSRLALAHAFLGQLSRVLAEMTFVRSLPDDSGKVKVMRGWFSVIESTVLNRLGRYEEARERAVDGVLDCLERWGGESHHMIAMSLALAEANSKTGSRSDMSQLLRHAEEWSLLNDSGFLRCRAALLRATIHLDGGLIREAGESASAEEAEETVEEGLRIARHWGYGIYHIDLLLVRAHLALHEGRADDARRDILTVLFGLSPMDAAGTYGIYDSPPLDESSPENQRGIFPPKETGLPDLLAATNPDCGYAWGIAEGRHLLGETLLLKAAQIIGTPTHKSRSRPAPPEVRALIGQARSELQEARRLWKRLRDPESDAEIHPEGEKTQRVLNDLRSGRLTGYPVES